MIRMRLIFNQSRNAQIAAHQNTAGRREREGLGCPVREDQRQARDQRSNQAQQTSGKTADHLSHLRYVFSPKPGNAFTSSSVVHSPIEASRLKPEQLVEGQFLIILAYPRACPIARPGRTPPLPRIVERREIAQMKVRFPSLSGPTNRAWSASMTRSVSRR